MVSVKFDGIEIVNATYIPRFVKHETAPERELTLLNLAREDGQILVAEKYGAKRIILTGNLTGTTKADLESKIDSFKELFSRKEKNLDISWETTTRRYVATCTKHNFDRDHFHLTFVPWTAEFMIVKGIGTDITETTIVNNVAFNAGHRHTSSVTLAGSASPKPRIGIRATGACTTATKGISIENTDTKEKIIVTRKEGMVINRNFEVDCALKTVKYDGVERDFFGVFPTFKVGANNYKLECGAIVDQEFNPLLPSPTGVFTISRIFGNEWAAQSFMTPAADDTYQTIEVYIHRQGNPPQNLILRIETDLDGKPSGTLVDANSHSTISPADVSTSRGWVATNTPAAYALKANTRYWLVLKQAAAGGNMSNNYAWRGRSFARATYKRGNAANSTAGAIWTDHLHEDRGFRICYGGAIHISHPVPTYRHDIFYFKRYL